MKNHRVRSAGIILLVMLLLLPVLPAMAQNTAYKAVTSCRVYEKADQSSPVIGTLQKGEKVQVAKISGKWAQLQQNGKVGYALKAALKKTSASQASQASTIGQIQRRLNQKGYLHSAGVTGKTNPATTKAIRIFQMMNGLKVTGKANSDTVKKLMSGSAKRRAAVSGESWSKSGIESHFKRGGTASIIDMATGARLAIRRVGGHEHLDVEPKTASDTAILKKLYGGKWSWDSRAVLLITGGKYYAAAMNGMPHGAQINRNNNFDGQFCIHLKDSICHGSGNENALHQANIRKVIAYFD